MSMYHELVKSIDKRGYIDEPVRLMGTGQQMKTEIPTGQ